MRVAPTQGWCRSCARRLTSPYGRRKSRRSHSGRWCPHLWPKSAISGSALLRWAMSTKCAFSTLPSPRLGCLAILSRTVHSSSRQYRSRPRPSNTSCPGVMHQSATAMPWGRAQSAHRRGRPLASSRSALPRAELSPRPTRQASRRSAAPPVSQLAPKSSRKATKRPRYGQPRDVGSCSFSGDGEDSAAPSPGGGPSGESFVFCSAGNHIVKERAISFSSGFSDSQADSVRCTASFLAHNAPFCQQPRDCGWETQCLSTHLWPVPPGTWGVLRGWVRTRCLLHHPALLPSAAPPRVHRLFLWCHL